MCVCGLGKARQGKGKVQIHPPQPNQPTTTKNRPKQTNNRMVCAVCGMLGRLAKEGSVQGCVCGGSVGDNVKVGEGRR